MLAAYQIFNGRAPVGTPKALTIIIDFTTLATQRIDLSAEEQFQVLENIQTIWIDNMDNFNPLVLTCDITGQRLIVPPTSQGFFSALSPSGKFTLASIAVAGLTVKISLMNIPIATSVWNDNTPFQGPFTNKSGSIGVGGTSQTLSAANANRKRIIIQNPSTIAGQNIAATESLFINIDGSAAGVNDGTSIELVAGGSFDSADGPCPTGLITVNAASIAHRYIAKEV